VRVQEEDDRAGFGPEPQHLPASKALALEAQRRWVERFDAGDGCPVDDTSVVIVWLRCARGEAAATATREQKEALVEKAARETPAADGSSAMGARRPLETVSSSAATEAAKVSMEELQELAALAQRQLAEARLTEVNGLPADLQVRPPAWAHAAASCRLAPSLNA
jgi:hypothetical protein